MIGNDGGLAQTWDMALTWVFVPNLPVGLFYHVSVDMATPFNICGGMQDNLNDYETYVFASKDYGQSWNSLNGNLEGEEIKSDANALFARAAAVSTSLAKYDLKLEAPKPVDTGGAARKKTQ